MKENNKNIVRGKYKGGSMKTLGRIFIAILCSLLLFSCNKKEESVKIAALEEPIAVEEERVKVTIYCYDVAPLKGLTPLLEERFPDVDISVITGVNDISFITMVNEQGELPDIICMRRFSLNDAKYIRSNLLDLSRTEIAAKFHPSILEQNRDEDGSIRWLPSCAEVDGLVVNRRLFEENGLELPKNYEEFKSALCFFKEKGITPFISDWRYDYTCLELLQGISISQLMSLEGVAWRQKYESENEGEHVLLDENVWLPVFEKFYDFLESAGIDSKDVNKSFLDVNNAFDSGNAVVSRNTAGVCMSMASTTDMDVVMLPFYGETENDNWILTYPTYQVAVSKKVEESSSKKQTVLDMVSFMLSKEGEEAIVLGAPLLSYTSTNQLELSPVFDTILPEIERNHIYMRLASTEFFSVSKTVVQDILKGKHATPREAYEAFNELLSKDAAVDDSIVYTSPVYEPYGMTEGGNRAESSTLSLIKDNIWINLEEKKKYLYVETESYVKPEVAISFSGLNATSVFEGDYTTYMMNNVICPRKTLYVFEMTGKEINSLMKEFIDVRDDGNKPIIHENMIPVVSGMTYSIKNNGDGTFTYMGSDLDEEKTYKGICIGNINVIVDNAFAATPISKDLSDKLISTATLSNTLLINIVKNGGSFRAAEAYLSIV